MTETTENYRDEEAGGTLACRIPGLLAVDVCKGFAVTMMCLSCEKCSSKYSSSKVWVKHVVGKARCPKKNIIFITLKNKAFQKNKWEGEEGKPKHIQTKNQNISLLNESKNVTKLFQWETEGGKPKHRQTKAKHKTIFNLQKNKNKEIFHKQKKI